MVLSVFSHLKSQAAKTAYRSVLYNFSLRGYVPKSMVLKPVDLWPGDAENGRWLMGGAFVIDDEQLAMRGTCWEPVGVSNAWLSHMHGFSWLRDLKALGGHEARSLARAMIDHWITHYKTWNEIAWSAQRTGERLSLWLSLYEFFGDSAPDHFQSLFFDSTLRQARHLSRVLASQNLRGADVFYAAQGLLYVGVCFEGFESYIGQALKAIGDAVDEQIFLDGGHVSKNPATTLRLLQILIDVRRTLKMAKYPMPEKIQHAIDRSAQAVKFFRCSDKRLCLFNGTQKGDKNLINVVLAQAESRGSSIQSLPQTGYEKLAQGRTSLMIDTGKAPVWPYDRRAHCAPLAFEMTYGRERVFVSCGSHPTDPAWREALRATAAHNTAVLEHRNACEINVQGSMSRKANKVVCVREENKNEILLEGSHDGYVPLFGVTHARRFYMHNKGHDVRGEDVFTCLDGLVRPLQCAVRFHLHPNVQVSLIRDEKEALLRLRGGVGWRFQLNKGVLRLEDSVYLGDGVYPRKTKQLAIYSQIESDCSGISWALQRQG